MATFNLCNQFDQIAEGKVVYYGTEHTEYADLEQPKEEKPKKKFSAGRLFNKFLGGLVAVVAVSAVVGLAVAYAASVVLTGGASLAALPVIAAGAGVVAAGFTAYRGGQMLEAQYQNDKANQEEGSWGDYIGGALVNTANIGAQEAVMTILFLPANVVGSRVIGKFASKYGSKLFAKLGVEKKIKGWFKAEPKPEPKPEPKLGPEPKLELEPEPKPVSSSGEPRKIPPWRQAEIDVRRDSYPGYREQVGFKGGQELDQKRIAGCTVPDLYLEGESGGHAVEVKRYLVNTPERRSHLCSVLKKQITYRAGELPPGTRQTIVLDVREQDVSREVLKELKQKIEGKVPEGVEILFKMK